MTPDPYHTKDYEAEHRSKGTPLVIDNGERNCLSTGISNVCVCVCVCAGACRQLPVQGRLGRRGHTPPCLQKCHRQDQRKKGNVEKNLVMLHVCVCVCVRVVSINNFVCACGGR